MEEGTLAKWLVQEGDTVAAGDLLAEIETDKATMEFEAVDEGVVTKLVVPAGTEGVKVGAVIALIGGEGEGAGPAITAAAPASAAPAPPVQGGGESGKRAGDRARRAAVDGARPGGEGLWRQPGGGCRDRSGAGERRRHRPRRRLPLPVPRRRPRLPASASRPARWRGDWRRCRESTWRR
jgi:pyruvate dehydrogenase E2 component (dihydrolipoamide acetyltransferase)